MTMWELDDEAFDHEAFQEIFLELSQYYEEAEKEAGDLYVNEIIV